MNGSLALFSLLTAALLTGCMGTHIKARNAPLGKEASASAVLSAYEQATSGISIANAKVGSCATYELNYRINADPVIMSQLVKYKLLGISAAAQSVVFNVFEDSYDFFPSGAIKNQVHRQLSLAFQTNSIRPLFTAPASQCNGKVRDDGDGIKYDCVRYYNLKTDDVPVPAPLAVQEKPDCLGFAGCNIPVHHISFDAVKFLHGKEVNKTTVDARFSTAIPDLFYLPQPDGSYVYTQASTSFCTTTVETGPDNSNYIVRFCSVLRDMQPDGNGDCFPPTP